MLLQRAGLDTEKLLLCQPDSGEMALEVVDQSVRSSAVDIICVDSVAALVPRSEIEGEMGATQGAHTLLSGDRRAGKGRGEEGGEEAVVGGQDRSCWEESLRIDGLSATIMLARQAQMGCGLHVPLSLTTCTTQSRCSIPVKHPIPSAFKDCSLPLHQLCHGPTL